MKAESLLSLSPLLSPYCWGGGSRVHCKGSHYVVPNYPILNAGSNGMKHRQLPLHFDDRFTNHPLGALGGSTIVPHDEDAENTC